MGFWKKKNKCIASSQPPFGKTGELLLSQQHVNRDIIGTAAERSGGKRKEGEKEKEHSY